ncbi:hypothetical protein WOLCODRAFT_70894 [Wolfiporia cocos MD-104 SS10]|uniref:BHLH domain-containing protein n=1 Tax=Wolfiporia cocos (strain MD-104) TaxID=742152 RepID=A0A2H3JQW8_WOLCO|nr:hypothetical protein WOLCODRAFT_70894 [Wolfiporia cocos MD-104 SS10]
MDASASSSSFSGEHGLSNTAAHGSPASTATPRHSPITPLAPLEFLQNQRRGSITDPSLHAVSTPHSHLVSSVALHSLPASLRHLHSPPGPGPRFLAPLTSPDLQFRAPLPPPRPMSPFRFGDASAQPSEAARGQPRRPLRSSSVDAGKRPALNNATRSSDGGPERSMSGTTEEDVAGESQTGRAQGIDRMDVDPQEREQAQRHEQGRSTRPDPVRESAQVEYNARRHSITAGTKRKISDEKGVPMSGAESRDAILVGPGVPSGSNVAAEGPAPKRRGSAFDTSTIAQLSLYERRNSVDGRMGGGMQRWTGERRDSATGSTPVTSTPPGHTTPPSAFPGDSPHGRPPGGIATFAWPANPHPDQAAGMHNDPNVNMHPGPAQHYDPLAIMPPVTFTQDRRMSAPAISPENLPTPPASGPARVLRSRSRPPSRVRGIDQTAASSAPGPSSAGSTKTEDVPQSVQPSSKEPGSTPYSRSPELRISHKLAERKRRKEMKDLFDELRDQLPADRGMKASKWEILSKAIDFIVNLKQSHQDMNREIDMLRHELDTLRHGIPPPFAGGPPPQSVVYAHGPPVGVPPYPHVVQPGGPPPGHQGPPPHPGPQHQPPPHPQPPLSRPGSSQNMFPPGAAPSAQPPNASGMGGPGAQTPRTDAPS